MTLRDGEEEDVMNEQQKFIFSNQQRRQHLERKLESLKRDVVSEQYSTTWTRTAASSSR